MLSTHSGILFILKKEENLYNNNMYESGAHDGK